jgi:hypothetical protein
MVQKRSDRGSSELKLSGIFFGVKHLVTDIVEKSDKSIVHSSKYIQLQKLQDLRHMYDLFTSWMALRFTLQLDSSE